MEEDARRRNHVNIRKESQGMYRISYNRYRLYESLLLKYTGKSNRDMYDISYIIQPFTGYLTLSNIAPCGVRD